MKQLHFSVLYRRSRLPCTYAPRVKYQMVACGRRPALSSRTLCVCVFFFLSIFLFKRHIMPFHFPCMRSYVYAPYRGKSSPPPRPMIYSDHKSYIYIYMFSRRLGKKKIWNKIKWNDNHVDGPREAKTFVAVVWKLIIIIIIIVQQNCARRRWVMRA